MLSSLRGKLWFLERHVEGENALSGLMMVHTNTRSFDCIIGLASESNDSLKMTV